MIISTILVFSYGIVAISPIPSIKPPSPTKPITFLSGLAIEPPIAVAEPRPIAPAKE
jgi:hypothetical protein